MLAQNQPCKTVTISALGGNCTTALPSAWSFMATCYAHPYTFGVNYLSTSYTSYTYSARYGDAFVWNAAGEQLMAVSLTVAPTGPLTWTAALFVDIPGCSAPRYNSLFIVECTQ